MKIFKEIRRCFPQLVNPVLKFTHLNDATLMLATDDKETYAILSGKWPDDAFQLGVERPAPKPITTPHLTTITLKGVSKVYDLEDEDIIAQLAVQGITNAERLKNKDNNDTVYVSARCSNFDIATKLTSTGVNIGPERVKAEFRIKPQQCYHCQQFGHSHSECQFQQKCVRCSGPHELSECEKKNEIKCANCNKNHPSCSRSCEAVKQAVKDRITSVSYARVVSTGSHSLASASQPPKNAVSIPQQEKSKDLVPIEVHNQIVDQLKSQVADLQKKLDSLEALVNSLLNVRAPQLSLLSPQLPNPVQVSNHPIQQ